MNHPRNRDQSLAGILIAVMILAVGCAGAKRSDQSVTPGGHGLISLAGTVGAVRLNVATVADVKAAVGLPEATAEDSFRFPGARRYEALGYGCTSKNARSHIPLTYGVSSGPYCQTVYYINLAQGVLVSFWTASSAFHTTRGTRVGTPTEIAARRERRAASNGCHIGVTEASARLTLVIDIAGFRERPLHPGRNDHLARPTGGRVVDLAEDSQRSGVGLLFC
jgi:hypothetical protein